LEKGSVDESGLRSISNNRRSWRLVPKAMTKKDSSNKTRNRPPCYGKMAKEHDCDRLAIGNLASCDSRKDRA
jgi:hypothetical protein